MKEWREYPFDEFVLINPLISLEKGKEYSFVEMKDINSAQRYCEPQATRVLSGGSRFQESDTLFARITPCLENGKIAQVNNLLGGVGFGSTEFLIFRGKKNISNSSFIYYLSKWKEVRSFAEINLVGTSGRQRINKECFSDLSLLLPPLPEQKAIASVLSSLDDKIDLLHRQNATLEGMAETLFRQWFVVEAKDEWERITVKDVADVNRQSRDKNYPNNEILYLDTGSLTEGNFDQFQYYLLESAPSRAQRLVAHNDILISLVRPNQKHYGIVRNPPTNLIVSTGFCVLTCNAISPYFLYLFLTRSNMTEYLHGVAEGSTSAYPALKPSDIANLKLQLPPANKLLQFNNYADSVWEKITYNQTQIRTLEKLRDTLLPKLMSGEVRVRM